MEFKEILKKPFTNAKNLLIGILLSIVPIINFFAIGYTLECSGVGEQKASKKLPEWQDWGGYFAKGFLFFLISLIYSLPVIILNLIFFGNEILQFVNGSIIDIESLIIIMTTELTKFVIAGILTLIFGLFISYILYSAILNYLKTKNFGSAFEFGKILERAFTKLYFIAWIKSLLVWIVIGVITAMFSGVWILSIIISPAGAFIRDVITYTLMGDAYRKLR